ncbi:hypothetical protein CFC21_016428 [Triticum aestivum]|uniref:Uncharacterized protein n=2 Tax=Triticum aestivum TaxID=4565 RepID=A0A3B6NJQ5_WHEAT|nr:coniferyl alcohol acyltransferase-like [Triticum aestivum]KAF7000541.1 hypothetical protein CFC21_016428 [Triticum aestivum]
MASNSRVRVLSRSTVKALGSSATPAPPRVLAVSNLDLLPQNIPVSLFCAYRRPSSGAGFRDVVAAFEAKLPSLLDHFLPLTGRIVVDPRSGRPEMLHCDNQGAELVLAESGVALASLDYGHLGASLAEVGVPVKYDAGVALSVQLVSFACGGFAIAWASNHVLMDGYSLCIIATAWSELARTGAVVSVAPNHDRSVFRPRATPSYGPSFGEQFTPLDGAHLVNALTTQCSFVERTYYVEARDLETLRSQASQDGVVATRLEALSAYLWKAFAAVVGASDESCRMGWWVNGRRRLSAPRYRAAMRDYVGNVTTFAVAEAGVEDTRRRSLQDIASTVRETIRSTATDEHFQQLVDWVEEHRATKYIETATVGLGSPALSVTSFATFSLDTDFGFGRAALTMPTGEDCGRLCSGFVQIIARPGDDGWLVAMYVWPRLAGALDSDDRRIFKPLTADYLGLCQYSRL